MLLAACLAAIAIFVAAPAWAQQYVPGRMLVRWKPGLKAAAREAAMSPLGASRMMLYDMGAELVRVVGVSVEEAVARLSQDPRVEYAEPDYLMSIDRAPNDPRYPEQYALHNTGQTGGTPGADISAERAWERFTGDPDLLIGDIDTGADYDHPDLAPNIWTNPGEWSIVRGAPGVTCFVCDTPLERRGFGRSRRLQRGERPVTGSGSRR